MSRLNILAICFRIYLMLAKPKMAAGNNPTVIDVTTFVRDVTSGLMASAVSKQLTLVYGPDAAHTEAGNSIAPAYYVRADQSHYREVLSNLIENAIKYTKSGGTITVDITGDNAHVVVSVVDNGIGIPKEYLTPLPEVLSRRQHRYARDRRYRSGPLSLSTPRRSHGRSYMGGERLRQRQYVLCRTL